MWCELTCKCTGVLNNDCDACGALRLGWGLFLINYERASQRMIGNGQDASHLRGSLPKVVYLSYDGCPLVLVLDAINVNRCLVCEVVEHCKQSTNINGGGTGSNK